MCCALVNTYDVAPGAGAVQLVLMLRTSMVSKDVCVRYPKFMRPLRVTQLNRKYPVHVCYRSYLMKDLLIRWGVFTTEGK